MNSKGKRAVLEHITTSIEGLVQLTTWQMALLLDLQGKIEEVFAEPGKRAASKRPPPIPDASEVPMIKRRILPHAKKNNK